MGALAATTFSPQPKAQLPVSNSVDKDDKDRARLLAAEAKRMRKAQQRILAKGKDNPTLTTTEVFQDLLWCLGYDNEENK